MFALSRRRVAEGADIIVCVIPPHCASVLSFNWLASITGRWNCSFLISVYHFSCVTGVYHGYVCFRRATAKRSTRPETPTSGGGTSPFDHRPAAAAHNCLLISSITFHRSLSDRHAVEFLLSS